MRVKPGSTDVDREDEPSCSCDECTTKRLSTTKSREPWSDFQDIDPRPKNKNKENGDEFKLEPRI